MTKNYGLTQKPGLGVSDKAPDWMESLFVDKMTKTASNKKASPFEGVDDKFLNPNKHGLQISEEKCEECGKPLSHTNIDICDECSK